MLDHTRSRRFSRSGIGGTPEADRRNPKCAGDGNHAGDFVQGHGDSFFLLPPNPANGGNGSMIRI
jgi:hypothetical protein